MPTVASAHVALAPVALALGAGVAIGLCLPHLARLRRSRRDGKAAVATADANAGGSTHAVRGGLSGGNDSSIRLQKQALIELLAACLTKAGASPAHAAQAADVLAFADARGIPSHGANRADTYANEIEAGLVDGQAVPMVERSTGCCAVINGNNALGAVVCNLAMSTALRLAKEHGVAVVACHKSNHYGAAGYWANQALEAGMIGLSFTNTAPFAAATGGRTRAVGTNPFCCFAPACKGDSFQLDMATTVVPVGKIEVMDRIGKPLPAGWAVDRYGRSTSDAAEVVRHGALYPLGGAVQTAGYKGYGLGMWIEIMSSVLAGAAIGPDVQPWTTDRERPIDFGHCFLVLDPSRFTPGCADRLGHYLRTMRGLPGDVKVPGDPERAYERDADDKGILLHRSVATTLKALAKRFAVQPPAAFASLDASASRGSLFTAK